MPAMPHSTVIRLEKAATDAGFDLEPVRDGDWIRFATSRSPVQVWLITLAESLFIAAVSQQKVIAALVDHGSTHVSPLPPGAAGARCVTSWEALANLLYRVIPLARTLPDELLHVFQARTANLPRSTEAERLVVQRVGQDIVRDGLLEYWHGRCAVTGLAVPELLRASHIKPWADCETDAERLDVFNGLLLAPNWDAAFDAGFITFDDDGRLLVSERLDADARDKLGLAAGTRLAGLGAGHRRLVYPLGRRRNGDGEPNPISGKNANL